MADWRGPLYDTVDDAAAGGLFRIANNPEYMADKYENVGMVFRDPDSGKYYNSPVTPPNPSPDAEVHAKADFDLTGEIAAMFHNHPAQRGKGLLTTEFSPQDIRTQASIGGKPSYITSINPPGPDGKPVLPDDVRATEKRRYLMDGRTKVGEVGGSEPFLAQFPIEELKLQVAQRIKNGNLPPALKLRLLQNLLKPTPTTSNNQ